MPRWIAALLLCALTSLPAWAATLRVGPGEAYTRISDAARVAADGDTIEIAAGEYRGDVAVWTQRRLTIRGMGSGAVLIADGASAENKAIWVIRNGDFDIHNLTFRGTRVRNNNGAGIRFEHGRLRVVNCRFLDNQTGIMSSNDGVSELIVIGSEFGDAPHNDLWLPHLLYAGRMARLTVIGSSFHGGYRGHLLKSRARENFILYNRLVDGSDGGASYELEFPQGGRAVVVGNIIGQSRNTQNISLIAYGAEKAFWPDNGLYLAHNTLLDELPAGGRFVRIWSESFANGIAVVARNNLLIGNGAFDIADDEHSGGNHRLRAGQAGTPAAPDFRLPADSPLRGQRFDGPATPYGELTPRWEFIPPRGSRQLDPAQPLAPGAVQTPSSE